MDLKRYLFEQALPVKKFAEQLEVSVSLIYHILKGHRVPSPQLAKKIEELTKGAVSKEELLFPDQKPPKRWVLNEDEVQERLENYEERLSKLEKIIDDQESHPR